MKRFTFLLTFISVCLMSFSHSDTLDVTHYNINLEITDFTNKIIDGHTTLSIKSKVDNLEIICLDLLALEIDSITIDGQQNPTYTYNDTLIRIFPEDVFNQDDVFDVTVYYQGSPVVDPSGWGGFYFSGQRAFNLGVGFDDVPHNYGRVWYPCVDDFVDRATYDFYITVLNNHKAVCGGMLISTEEFGNDKTTYHWSLTDNIPTYLSSVAVGEYVMVSDVFNGINGEIPIQIFAYPGDSLNAVNSFQNLKDYLEVFEDKFGAYRWQRVGYVAVPFNSGAMEHATNIAIPAACFNGNTAYEDLFSHELAHHWFGDLVTCREAGDMWLNEGWASYSESVFREAFYGRKNMQDYRRSTHSEVVRYAHIEDGGFLPLYGIPLNITYGTTVYDKGEDVAHTLRCYLGDELFFSGVTEYLNEFAFSDASSYDFRDFLTTNTGVDLTDFFNDWVFTGGFPHYSIDSFNVVPGSGNFEIEVFVKQKLRGRETLLTANVVPVTFMAEDYSDTTVYMYFSDEIASESFTINFNPKFVFCDFYEQVADATVDEYRFLKNTNIHTLSREYIKIKASSLDENIDSVFMHVTHNWAPPDSFKIDVPGLILANNRYWTIQGDFPENCSFKGEFLYSNTLSSGINGYLDNEFITNDLDSLVIMYRPNKAEDWEIVVAENITVMKRFIVENLQAGEYTLAIKNWDLYLNNKILTETKNDNISIYPNPSTGNFNINFKAINQSYNYATIRDINGKLIDKINTSDNTTILYSFDYQINNGIYFISFYNEQDLLIETKKLLFQK